jgi:hypothetical protein
MRSKISISILLLVGDVAWVFLGWVGTGCERLEGN